MQFCYLSSGSPHTLV